MFVMIGFEPRTRGFGSDRSTNRATTTYFSLFFLHSKSKHLASLFSLRNHFRRFRFMARVVIPGAGVESLPV